MSKKMLCETQEVRVREHQIALDPATTAVVVTDMFDTFWCGTFTSWVNDLAPRIDRALIGFRERDIQIIFMAGGLVEKYDDAPQYLRMLAYPHLGENPHFPCTLEPAAPGRWPIGGCVCRKRTCNIRHDWNRIHPALTIEPEDLIGRWGDKLHNACQALGLTHLLYCGVATNMCVLDMRDFSMVPMARYGYHVMLLRDLTEALVPKTYREEGLRLSIRYIERFIAPTTLASQLLGQEENK